MATPMSARVFPLHLTPLESFMLADDRPRYPMTFTIHVDLEGTIDRSAFERALEEGLNRHPLLTAVVGVRKLGRLCWLESPDARPPVDWADASVPVAPAGEEMIDLYSETGLRIWVRQGDRRARITAQFHHSASDGIGAYRFLGDVLAVYGSLTAENGAETPTLAAIDLGRLRGRADKAMSPDIDTRPLPIRAWKTTKFFVPFRTQTCQKIAAPRPEQSQPLRAFPAVDSFTFSQQDMKRLRGVAADFGVTLNDMLLADLFLTIADWNGMRQPKPSRRCYRIMVPVDLREAEDYATPATNLAAFTFVRRYTQGLADPGRLLATIRDDTARIKHYRLGTVFADVNYSLERAKPIRRWLLDLNLCTSTAVLSNVGDPAKRFTARFPRQKGAIVCGNLVLKRITGAPPIRRHTRASLSVFSYRRELTLTVRTDPFFFTESENREFLAAYVRQIAKRLGHEPQDVDAEWGGFAAPSGADASGSPPQSLPSRDGSLGATPEAINTVSTGNGRAVKPQAAIR